jgi:N-acetylglutamate synthase-like GNAT family acetyltransferase
VRWVVDQAQAELLLRYGVMVDSELSLSLHQFAPPLGAFVVARQPRSRHPIGGVGVRSVSAHIGEVKRLWVDDNERGKRVGLALMEAAQAAARDLG